MGPGILLDNVDWAPLVRGMRVLFAIAGERAKRRQTWSNLELANSLEIAGRS